MPLIDPNKNPLGLDRRLKHENNPRYRRMLEEVRLHIATEAACDIEPALARLAPDPVYYLYDHAGPTGVIRGKDEIRANFYDELTKRVEPRLEWDIVRCMVDGDAVVTEGQMKVGMRGSDLITQGMDVDPDGFYLRESRHLVVWPFDDQLRLIGETVYFGYSTPLEDVIKHRLRPEDFGDYTGPVIQPSTQVSEAA